MKRQDRELLLPEFDRQVRNLPRKGYPRILGIKVIEFQKNLQLLRRNAAALPPFNLDLENGRLPICYRDSRRFLG